MVKNFVNGIINDDRMSDDEKVASDVPCFTTIFCNRGNEKKGRLREKK